MDENGFRKWLADRGVEKEAIDAIVADSNKVKEVYEGLTSVGAALDHEIWLDDLTSSARGTDFNQVVWVQSGITRALIAFLEQS